MKVIDKTLLQNEDGTMTTLQRVRGTLESPGSLRL